MLREYLAEIIHQAVELRRLENSLARAIRREFEAITEVLTIFDAADKGATRRRVVARFQSEVVSEARKVYAEIGRLTKAGAVIIAEKQSARAVTAMAEASGAVRAFEAIGRERLREILGGDAIDGLTVSEWHKRNEARFLQRVRAQTRLGLQRGETLAAIKERVEKFAYQPARRHAETLARTAANNLANAAIYESAEASGLSRGYRLIVTFDGRTSPICLAYGKRNRVYPYAPSSPRPPLHWACRTIIKPVLIGGRDEAPQDAGAWFARQSNETQNHILGARRAELFRKGKLDLSDLIRSDSSIKSLPELRGLAASF